MDDAAAAGLSATATATGDAALAAALAGHRVLLAYGLLGEVMSALRPIGIDYMGKQLDWLCRGLRVEARVVRLPTAAPVAANGARLAEVLRDDPRPALLIAHSKGGLESLAALCDPAAAARCRGLLALQSPFRGSPVADALLASRAIRGAAGGAVQALKLGSGEGLADLTTAARAAWMAAHAAEVAAALARVPVLTVATQVTEDCPWPDRRYLPLVRWVAKRAGPNDGLVPVSSALLEGTMQMVLPGAHRTLVAAARGRDPVGQLRMLLGRLVVEGGGRCPPHPLPEN